MGKKDTTVLGKVGNVFPRTKDDDGVEGALDPQRRFYSALDLKGEHVEIPCPNRRCKSPICLDDRTDCTHSDEDSSPSASGTSLGNASSISMI